MDRAALISLAQTAVDDARAAMRLHLRAIEQLGVIIDQLDTLEQPEPEAATPAHLRPAAEPPRLSTIGPPQQPRTPQVPLSFGDPNEYPVDEEIRSKILAFNDGLADPEDPQPA